VGTLREKGEMTDRIRVEPNEPGRKQRGKAGYMAIPPAERRETGAFASSVIRYGQV